MDKVDSSSNTNSKLIIDIHNFLQEGEKNITYTPGKDIVLLLGNTGSGKSTLTQYISGNDGELESIEIGKDSGNFLIIDKKNKISSKSTIVSHTIYPDLVKHAKTNTLYYDCPGFSDTRSTAHEIAATYFIKKVIDSARAVKMVFVVNHNSVSAAGSRNDLVQMLQHSANFIKKLETFKNSIALVVTKIQNITVRGKTVPDEKVINAVGDFLKQAKEDLKENTEMVNPNTKDKVMSLLDIFLSKGENEQYTRIGIFRKPDASGSLNKIALLQEGKITLENLINNNIKFAEVGKDDFGYTISAKSKVQISGLAEEINKTIVNLLYSIGKEVEKHWNSQKENISDLEYFSSRFRNLSDHFSKLQENAIKDMITPEMLITEIEKNINNFKITISDDYLNTVKREEGYINFLNLLSNQSINNHKSSLLAAGLSNLINYLSDSNLFYHYLYNMYQKLSEFDIQKNRNKYSTLHVNTFNDFLESPTFKEIETILKENSGIKEMKLDPPKLVLLNKVLDQTLKYQIEVTTPQSDKIILQGVNVILSDLRELLSNTDVKFIEVHALHKVFIDTSLDFTGREIQMAIVAPVWEVVGSQSIILDGKPGMDHLPQKARSGNNYGESGADGLPGEPGGPAGHFIGIGKHFINEENLRFSANGGRGGNGQDGGDGAEGYDGAHCPNSCDKTADGKYIGGDGGHGGNGGVNGYGGHKGTICTVKVGIESELFRVKQDVQDGHPGRIGLGGAMGKGGRYFYYDIRVTHIFYATKSFRPTDKWGNDGKPGNAGTNQLGRRHPHVLPKLINLNNTITEYKKYLISNIKNNLQETFLTTFLGEMDSNQTSLSQPTNRKRRNIMNFTGIEKSEEQLRNKHDHYPTEIQSQNYEQYVGDSEENYYLDLNSHIYDSKPISRDIFLEAERIKHTPSISSDSIPVRLENMKVEKNVDINGQYPLINLHGNLLLSELVLKKLMGIDTSSNNINKQITYHYDNKHSSKAKVGSGHDLAYSHYRTH